MTSEVITEIKVPEGGRLHLGRRKWLKETQARMEGGTVNGPTLLNGPRLLHVLVTTGVDS